MTQPTVPVCYRHPARETYLRCSRCDRPICPACMNDAAVGHHCPDCVAAGRRTQRAPRTAFGGTVAGQHGHVTKALIGLNIAVAVAVIVLSGQFNLLLGGITVAHEWGGMQAGPAAEVGMSGVADGEYYRLLTSMFLHYGVFHLLLNMYALWVVGGVLEPLLGRIRFLALYLVSGLGGSVATYLFAARLTADGFPVVSAGASGAVFGLFGAFYVVLRRLGRDTSMITMVLVVNVVLTFLVPFISIWGHLGGLVTGALVALGLAYAPRQHRTTIQLAAIGAVAVLLAVLTAVRTAALT